MQLLTFISPSSPSLPPSLPPQQVVLQVVGVFLDHIDHFKRYSSFCASHQIVKQILGVLHLQCHCTVLLCSMTEFTNAVVSYPVAAEDNKALIEFFRVRNPTTNPSLNVDSLLAKPIVVS